MVANSGIAMIRIFSQYVSARLALLFGLEALVLIVSAYAGIAFQYSGLGAVFGAQVGDPVVPV